MEKRRPRYGAAVVQLLAPDRSPFWHGGARHQLTAPIVYMNFIVTDRETIEQGVVVRTPYVVISIRDPGSRRPRLGRTSGQLAVLSLAFHDAEPASSLALPPAIRLMTRGHAERIWRFICEDQGRIGTIVCHCEQGMSRSPAVAAALAEALGVASTGIAATAQPNRYIYCVLRDRIAELAKE